jgi:hypothetical protein
LVDSDFRQHAPVVPSGEGKRTSFGIIPENKLDAQFIVRKTFCVLLDWQYLNVMSIRLSPSSKVQTKRKFGGGCGAHRY